jgi:hypothetical protein
MAEQDQEIKRLRINRQSSLSTNKHQDRRQTMDFAIPYSVNHNNHNGIL